MFRILLAILLVASVQTGAHVVAVVPNPVAEGDEGERIVLEFPPGTDLSGWSLTDGETTVGFPNRTVGGRIVATTDPDAVRNLTEHPVVALDGHLALSNEGDAVRLRRGRETVDEIRYSRAPEGERYVRDEDGWEWRHDGATDLAVASARDVGGELFVLPDAPDVALDVLEDARDRILLAGYTFASERVVRALCDARERDVRVRVLLDREPVGGLTERSATILDDLESCDVSVDLIGGEGARYAFHHAKYAVVDDRALVLTENWKPAGVGGRSSRGWGVVVESPVVASSLAETFRADAGWRDVVSWESAREGAQPVTNEPPPTERFPARFSPKRADVDRVDVVVAPDNAEERIVELLDGARESIRVEQLTIGSRGQPFVRALLRAAERGVRVRVILNGAWYAREDNAAVAAWLNERGSRDGLPIEARLAEPRSRYGKIHTKGAVVDGEVTILGSVNWNNASVRENREVAVILHGEDAGRYYARVFRSDWRGGVWTLPIGVAATVALCAVAGAWWGGRVRFEGQ